MEKSNISKLIDKLFNNKQKEVNIKTLKGEIIIPEKSINDYFINSK